MFPVSDFNSRNLSRPVAYEREIRIAARLAQLSGAAVWLAGRSGKAQLLEGFNFFHQW
jgi:hypothetical protein